MKIAVIADSTDVLSSPASKFNCRPFCFNYHSANGDGLIAPEDILDQTQKIIFTQDQLASLDAHDLLQISINSLSSPNCQGCGFIIVKIMKQGVDFRSLQAAFPKKGFVYFHDGSMPIEYKSYSGPVPNGENANFTHDVNFIGIYRYDELFTFSDLNNLRFQDDYYKYIGRPEISVDMRVYLAKHGCDMPSINLGNAYVTPGLVQALEKAGIVIPPLDAKFLKESGMEIPPQDVEAQQQEGVEGPPQNVELPDSIANLNNQVQGQMKVEGTTDINNQLIQNIKKEENAVHVQTKEEPQGGEKMEPEV